VDGLSFDSILETKASWLERDFEEEVRKVVKVINGDKALGLTVFLWCSSSFTGTFQKWIS
jgi:hypothetical protein